MKNTIVSVLLLSFLPICSLYSQLLLNEISGDSGNNDSENDGIVELINAGSTSLDASCTVLSNSEWTVVLPAGTIIAPGDVFLIACSEGQNSGSNPNPSPGSGLTCANCDFPNLPIDFDVCDPANAAFVDYAATGFTIDNSKPDDGDQIVLFSSDGTILDAVAWGCGSALLSADNSTLADPSCTTTSGRGGGNTTYTLGTATWNGNGNPALLPVALQSGGSCFTSGINYTMPPVSSGTYAVVNPVQNSCNSSMIRDISNTGIGSAGSWGQTEHPNPGEVNNNIAFQFFVDGSPVTNGVIDNIICTSPSPVTVSVEVYNYQHVEDVAINSIGSRITIGSYFSLNGSAPSFWNNGITGAGTSTTTLSHTFTPATGDEIVLVWDDWTQSPANPNCCGSGSTGVAQDGNDNVSQNGSDECYEAITLKYIIETPIAGTPTITCDDMATGAFSLSGITAGTSIIYELVYTGPGSSPVGDEVVSSSTAGMFTLANNTDTDRNDATNYTVRAVNSCSSLVATGLVCIGNPPCPNPQGATLNGGNAAITICPADCFDLTVDGSMSSDLPDGGTIDWYFGTDTSFDPCDETSIGFGGQLDNSSMVSVTASSIYTGTNIIINEILYDPDGNDGSGNDDTCESVEIAGPPGSNISCYAITDGDWTFQIPDGSIIPSDGIFLIASSGCDEMSEIDPSLIDLDISTCLCGSSGPDFNLTNSGEFLALSDPSGNVIDGVLFDTPSSTNSPSTTDETTIGIGVCNAFAIDEDNFSYVSADASPGESIARIDNAGGTWTDGTPTMGMLNLSSSQTTTVTTANNCFDDSFCNNGPYYIKGFVNPSATSSTCAKADVTVGPFEVNVVCPEVILFGMSEVCAPNEGVLDVTITNAPPNALITGIAITNATTGNSFPVTSPAAPATDANGDANFNMILIGESGDYTITNITIDGSTCPKISGIGTVTVFPQPDLVLSGTASVCPGEVAQLSIAINEGIPPFDVAVDTDGDASTDFIATINNTGVLNIPTSTSDAGMTINVNLLGVTDENDCIGLFSGGGTINVSSVPTPVTAGINPNICVENTTTNQDLSWTIADPGSGFTVDVYDVAVGGVVLVSGNDLSGGSGDITYAQSAVPLGATFPQTITRYFEVTETASGCTNFTRTPVSVTVNANPDFTPTVTQPTCTTDGMIQFAELSGGTYTYEYSTTGAAPYTSITPNGGNVTISLTQGTQSASTYTIRVTRTDTDPDCVSIEVANINAVTGCESCMSPSITTQPTNAIICSSTIPASHSFTVAASNNGTGTTLNYQWQVSTDGGTVFTDISGATASSYMVNISNVDMDGNQYRIIVTDPIDIANCIAISESALLTINNVNCSSFPWNGK